MKDKQKLYEDYKIKSFAKGKTPDSYEVWIKQFKEVDSIKPNNNEILAEKTNEEVETEKNFYTYEETANILKRSVSTIKIWLKENQNLILIGEDKIDKNSVDMFFLKQSKENSTPPKVAVNKKDTDNELIIKEDEDKKEEIKREIKKIIDKCYIAGYISCNNSFQREDNILHIIPEDNKIKILLKENKIIEDIYLADDMGKVITFENKLEARNFIVSLLRKISNDYFFKNK